MHFRTQFVKQRFDSPQFVDAKNAVRRYAFGIEQRLQSSCNSAQFFETEGRAGPRQAMNLVKQDVPRVTARIRATLYLVPGLAHRTLSFHQPGNETLQQGLPFFIELQGIIQGARPGLISSHEKRAQMARNESGRVIGSKGLATTSVTPNARNSATSFG